MPKFEIISEDSQSRARTGRLETAHGVVETPVFMPVGTKGTVKTLRPRDLRELGVEILLGNTYHLALTPGMEVIERAGGLHRFMRWDGPILTDSGGFQVFSLADMVEIDEEGVTFASAIDGGARHRFTPEEVIRIQRILGSDIMMVLDHVLPPSDHAASADALGRTIRWAERAVRAHATLPPGITAAQMLFPIVQGGVHEDLRILACRETAPLADVGIAVGGLSVGEEKPVMRAMLDVCDAELPRHLARYLMGVGSPEDLVAGVLRGIDMFDCVLPTRLARTGAAFTPDGRVSMRLERWKFEQGPLDPTCACECCAEFSASYVRHLILEKEILGMALLTAHNISFLLRLMERCRTEIAAGNFRGFAEAFLARYKPMGKDELSVGS